MLQAGGSTCYARGGRNRRPHRRQTSTERQTKQQPCNYTNVTKGIKLMAKDTAKVTDPTSVDWDSAEEIKKGFASFKFDSIGDTFIGTYVGQGEVVSDDGEIAEAFLFTDANGIDIGIWKSFDLNRKMEEIPEGAAVRIEYVTDVETKRGLNPMKQFSVKYKY